MATEKKAMLAVFKMDKVMSTTEWRERFSSAYQVIFDVPGLFFKSWCCNQEKKEWCGFYIFDSDQYLQAYIKSDLWMNKVPEKYGCKPQVTILEPGPIISKGTITRAAKSWMTE